MQEDKAVDVARAARVFSVPKHSDTPNEDCWSWSSDGKIFAVSDGASVSFDSAPWAEMLSRQFCSNPNVSSAWLRAAIAEYGARYDRESMSWMQQAAFDRGSFATLVGIVLSEDLKSVRVLAIGDSVFALLDQDRLVCTIPYSAAEDFDQSPWLLSTNQLENSGWSDAALSDHWHEIDLSVYASPALLLVTDAMARWLIEQPDSVSSLLEIRSDEEYAAFVTRERSEGRLKRDDTTLVVIEA